MTKGEVASCGVVYHVFLLFPDEQFCSDCELDDERRSDSRGRILMRCGTLRLIEEQCIHIPRARDESL